MVDELRLVEDPQFNPPPSSGSLDPALAYLTSLLPQEWLIRVGLAANREDADLPIADQPSLAREIAINRLR